MPGRPPGARREARRPGTLKRGAVAGALALGALVAPGCGGGQAGRDAATARPDIIFIVVDTLRADHLGCYGYPRPTSPRLDALAGQGTLFESAWAAAPWTLPSIMSMMTARYPSGHRVENDGLKLAADVPTLAAAMGAAGYDTAGFVSHVYVSTLFGFERGFARFEDFGLSGPAYRLEARMEPPADRVTRSALEWMAGRTDRPVFLFVHYFDPHWPYEPPEATRALFPSPYAGPLDAGYDSISKFLDPVVPIPADYRQFLIDRYDGEVRFVDDQIGRLLDGVAALHRPAPLWVVVAGDHGEEFKDHGSMGHGRRMYEEVVHVPLLVAAPTASNAASDASRDASGRVRGPRVAVPVSGVDVAPTILELAAAPALPGAQGRSLAAFVTSPRSGAAPPPDADRPLLSETLRINAYRSAVRIGPLKLIDFMDENRAEIYDLAADPGERRDLASLRPDDRRRLMQALFAQADLLSGGWNLRWNGDGRPHHFQGRITTSGIFRSIVPLFHEQGRYLLEKGNTLTFNDSAQAGESGLSFTTLPYEAIETFELFIDGRPAPEAVILGGQAMHPDRMPFDLRGAPPSDAAFERPPDAALKPPCFRMWRTRPATRNEPVTLDDETRARLRSLGYVQ
jgi:arylsulfatase A-like enzyme